MIPTKPAPNLIRSGTRLSEKIMRRQRAKIVHGGTDPRLLVRVWLDLLVPGGHAHRPAGSRGRRRGASTALPARTDFPGAGLGHLAIQPLPGQGPSYVARPRAHLRGAVAAVSAAGALSAIGSVGGTRGPGRIGSSFRQGRLGGGFLSRRLSRRVRRRAPHRSAGDDPQYSVRAESRS